MFTIPTRQSTDIAEPRQFSSTTLIGMDDEQLLRFAPEATHQHKKGGLYRLIGLPRDADTGLIMRDKDGHVIVSYEHIFPHPRQPWIRKAREFFDERRFRPLHRNGYATGVMR